ncbi:hypothetical protein P280DRAFT_539273 [Massarina eburnea CBS 473.64]|uniref:Phosphoribosylaminoimidazole-succinocarboxamide synthase n=1 Tax=Massarina eburnea CBS 473.64 TaxID=1395130 RepID=A0A6A6SAW1_9PLEO|nr:hypothetical protein P280DRAFT_539273 [Massarina eburnea CBS 473.64]
MSLEPDFQLKQTNVSRPRLSHTESQQSSQAASEGYYSLSDHTSSESDAPRSSRHHTPPSHARTPTQSHEQRQHADAPTPIASLRGVGVPRQHHAEQRPVSTIAEERPDTAMDADSLATTPGQDNTPYIRFAIDQLTRDEEVRGSRMYPLGQEGQQQAPYAPSAPAAAAPAADESDDSESEEYPVERIVSGDSMGYMRQEQRKQQRLSQYQPSPHQQQQQQQPPQPRHTPARDPAPHIPAREPKDVFVAHENHNVPLHFLPAILRPTCLAIFTFLCTLMLAALVFCAVYSNRDNGLGLWDYLALGDDRYFVFEYLPTLLGAVLFLWLIQVQIALQRIVPFIAMASDHQHKRSEAIFLHLYPMQFLFPRLEYFSAGQPLIGACYLIFWLFSWTIPLLASSFNVRYDLNAGVWRWVAVQAVIWTVAVLYILLVLALLTLLISLRNRTGLKWDPRSLADIVALLEHSNVVSEYAGSETFAKKDWECLKGQAGRLGYWNTTKRPNDPFHGFGLEGGSARSFAMQDGRITETSVPSAARKSHRPSDFSIRMDIRDKAVRHRHLPWYLHDSIVIAWIITALVLFIAFLVVSFVNSAVRLGFLPQVSVNSDAAGFSASNFLYSFIPALIGHLLFLVILTFDYTFRALRPYISLSTKGGATAENSLLVDYSCRLPISVTFAALENRDYQTFVLSLVSLSSITLPILAGGCFWTQWYPQENVVRVAANLTGYYALCFFLAIYALSTPVLWLGRGRAALPHRSNTIAEITSWVYQSPILTDRAFNRPQTKPELVARLMGSAYVERTWAQSFTSLLRPSRDNLRTQLAEKEGTETRTSSDPGKIRYGFGIHVGRDGLEHLGIDRVRRGGERSGRELVIWEEHNRKSWIGSAA